MRDLLLLDFGEGDTGVCRHSVESGPGYLEASSNSLKAGPRWHRLQLCPAARIRGRNHSIVNTYIFVLVVLTRQRLVRENGHLNCVRKVILVLHGHHDVEVLGRVIYKVCVLGRYHYLDRMGVKAPVI